MNHADRVRLVEAVQSNCHVVDAHHAADMTLCVYLLQMREFFRWERSLPFGAALERSEVGNWIAERESLWSAHEGRAFMPLPLGPGSGDFDPFDVETINAGLRPAGLLYGAGLIGVDRPVFFLAELHAQTTREGLEVLSAGRELARGLVAPPAALAQFGRGQAIVLRRESLARWCWEKFEAYRLRPRPGGAFHAAVEAYGFDRDFDGALPRWLAEQGETTILHELGEHRVGESLGPGWAAMRLALPTRRADLYVRAVRDHLADLQVTLPTLLDRDAAASLHFWFGSYDGVRETLFPSLASGYGAWRLGDGGLALRQAILRGRSHFAELARRVLTLHVHEGEHAGSAIERLLTAPDAVCSA